MDADKINSIALVGSSFAAGPGIQPIAHVGAGRSAANFGHGVADRLAARRADRKRPDVIDVSVSGATLANVLDERQAPIRPPMPEELKRGKTLGAGVSVPGELGSDGQFAPQITGVPNDVDLILLTAGGNDVGYLSAAVQASLAASSWFGWFLALLLGLFKPRPALAPDDEAGVTKRLADVVDALHARAPGARIVLVEYLPLYPRPQATKEDDVAVDRTMAATGLRREQIAHFAGIAAMLSRAYATVANDKQRQSWCSVVAVDEIVRREHALGSVEPYVDGFSLGDLLQQGPGALAGRIPLHPNKAGMDAVADLVMTHLENTRQ